MSTTLTAREREIAGKVAQGLKNYEIACDLGCGEQTVKNHLSAIFLKLGIKNRASLAVWAIRRELAA
jgi:DNA-binding NarL/FixJ family response regulator